MKDAEDRSMQSRIIFTFQQKSDMIEKSGKTWQYFPRGDISWENRNRNISVLYPMGTGCDSGRLTEDAEEAAQAEKSTRRME